MSEAELRQLATDHRRAGQFADAKPLYERLWSSPARDEWDGWGLAFCLRKMGRPAEALAVCDEVLAASPSHTMTCSLAGWCLYDSVVKNQVSTPVAIVNAAKRTCDLADRTPEGRYGNFSAAPRSVIAGARVLADHNRFDLALDLLGELKPTALSERPSMKEGKRLPSDREQWYLAQTKALDQLGRWETLRTACDEALAHVPVFTNGQDVWVQYRRARSMHHLGETDEAVEELEHLSRTTGNGAVNATLASYLRELGRTAEAEERYAAALLSLGDLGPGVNWMVSLADIMADRENTTGADLHLALAVAVRREKGWPVPDTLRDRVRRRPGPDDGGASDVDELACRVRPMWRELSARGVPSVTGSIAMILPGGFGGFVDGEDGVRYYLRLKDVAVGPEGLREGQAVTFEPSARLDKKKNRMSPFARKPRPL